MLDLDGFLKESVELVNKEIKALLPIGDDRLSQAMRYSALSLGKRLRPAILIAIADMFNVERKYSIRVAAALEIVHSYSLIHDDLPAMDDDDFRRGMLSCHKKFDEATAILAGDALLTLAFEILANKHTHPDAAIRCDLISILSQNIGALGIAGGQMLDLIYEREVAASYEELVHMHWMKTARLFIASCFMGATLGLANEQAIDHLVAYGEYFGLAFQFIDDLADLKESKLLNNNVVKLVGITNTKIMIDELIKKAKNELLFFADKDIYLNKLTDQLLEEIA